MIACLVQVPPLRTSRLERQTNSALQNNYWKHFPELPNNVRASGSFVACNHDIVQARFTARLLNKQESTRFSARLLNSKIASQKQCSTLASEKQWRSHCIWVNHHSSSKNCRHPDLAEPQLDPTLSIRPNQNDTVTQERLQSLKTNSSIQYLFSVTYDGHLTTKQHKEQPKRCQWNGIRLCKLRVQSRLWQYSRQF